MSSQRTVRDVAALVGGTAEGDLDAPIRDVKPLAEAGPGDVSFLANARYAAEFAATQATCVVVPRGLAAPPPPGRSLIRHENPYLAFAKLIEAFRAPPPRPPAGIHHGASVSPDARVGKDVAIGFGAVVEAGAEIGDRAVVGPLSYVGPGATIGEETRLYPRVVVYHGVRVGRRCILHSGCVVGADGFGYATDAQGRHHKVPQVGTVIVEDDVEIGANATIDRAVLGATRIGRGTKIDNLVQVAHNVEVGPGSILVAQCGISGSTKLGHHVVVAAQAGIVGHIEIGDMAQVAAQAGVTKDVPAQSQVLGAPAVPARDGLRAYALIDRLPEYKKAIADHERRLERLEKAAAGAGAGG
jgi:UDP-3-O-[3-hydroxymyristoyl] glucosamine N-acyltransferase